jgi:hypothetical protein
MDRLANDYPAIILAPREGPCISLYQPTHRTRPEKAQDLIRYRNLLRTVTQSLKQRYSSREMGGLLDPLHALADDVPFWNYTLDGMAALVAPGFSRVYKLQRTVPELAVVADSFHAKPLMRIMQSADRFQVLGLNRHRARLFEGTRDRLDEVPLAPDVPDSLEGALERDFGRDRDIRTYGPIRDAGKMGRHGKSDVKQDAIRADTEQFFRIVDRGVFEHHSRPTGMPLLLAALPEHHHLFREVSQNPNVLDAAIDVDPDDLSLDDLRARAWEIMLPRYLERLSGFIDQFNAARSRGQATADLADAARAVVEGRIATLLLDAGRRVPGRMDPATGAIDKVRLDEPDVDDLLDDLGERVLKTGGEVIVVPSERMPTESGLAAIYRF